MKSRLQVKCPYCGTPTQFMIKFRASYETRRKVVFCDVEEGGCDRPFAVAVRLTPSVETFQMIAAPAVEDIRDDPDLKLRIWFDETIGSSAGSTGHEDFMAFAAQKLEDPAHMNNQDRYTLLAEFMGVEELTPDV